MSATGVLEWDDSIDAMLGEVRADQIDGEVEALIEEMAALEATMRDWIECERSKVQEE